MIDLVMSIERKMNGRKRVYVKVGVEFDKVACWKKIGASACMA